MWKSIAWIFVALDGCSISWRTKNLPPSPTGGKKYWSDCRGRFTKLKTLAQKYLKFTPSWKESWIGHESILSSMHYWTLCCFSLVHTCTAKVLSNKVETREGWTLAHVDCWSLINVVPPSFFHTALFSSTLWAKTYLSTPKKEALEGTNGPKKALQKVSLKMSPSRPQLKCLTHIMSHSKYLSQTLKMSHFKCLNSSCLT